MVAVLSEWWLVPTTADHCGHIPEYEIHKTLYLNATYVVTIIMILYIEIPQVFMINNIVIVMTVFQCRNRY